MISSPCQLDVYSTTAFDTITYENQNGRIEEREGGPLPFIVRALASLSISICTHAGPTLHVRIRVTDNGETGLVTASEPTIAPPHCQSKRALISTIFTEWNPEVIAESGCEIFLDVQGFVRTTEGPKKMWDGFCGNWIQQVKCLKATEEELRYLPPASIEEQKSRILLITKGAEGVSAFINGKHIDFKPSRVINPKDTIGAGDTFFANVVGRLVTGEEVRTAVQRAMDDTEKFLETKFTVTP